MAEAVDADRGKFWSPVPDWRAADIERDDWSAQRILGLGQTLVSGRIDLASAQLAPNAPEVGLWAICETESCRVRIARDRMLIVTPKPLAVEPGWRESGWAASPADDLFAIIELSGAQVRDVVAEATAADLDARSPSAAILFAGVWAVLYRTSPHTARLHVEAPFAAYVWSWLEGRP